MCAAFTRLLLTLALLFGAAGATAQGPVDRTLVGDAVCTRCHDQGEAKPVLAADHLTGAALPGGALRLVVPGDRRAGRSVRDLARITID